MINKTLLLILDGWGIPEDKSHSAPDIANTPNFDNLLDSYSSAQLLTHEENVGLPSGQMGNSEVGHINIGAGRIVLQDLLKINNSIESGEFSKKESFIDIINYIKKSKKNVHLIGLLSNGGVHSHISHLKEILNTLSPIKKNLFRCKDIFNQITVTDPIRGGMTGLKRIDPQALNDLLTKDFLVGAGDAAESVSFAKSYSMFLNKQQIDDLYKLNAAVQSEVQRKTAGRSILQEAGAIGAKEDLSVSTVGKLIFGPLNPYTYRFGWRQRALAEKTQELLTEMVYDPDLLRKVMNQINRKADIDQTVRFLYSLDSVVAHDLGRELQLNYMEHDGENPFRSQDSMDYIKEFFSPVGTKTRGPKPGIIPGREILENAPILLPTAAALTGTAMGQNLSDKLLDRGAN